MRLPLKKIAMVCFSHSLGGLELSTMRLAQAMTKKGVPVVVVAPKASPLEQRALDANLEVVTISPWWKYGGVAAAFHLARLCREQNIEVMILMQSADIYFAVMASFLVRKVKLVFYQQMNSRYNKRDLVHSWLYSRISLWISLTQLMRGDVLAFTRMPPEKVKVVPLGTDLRYFNPVDYQKKKTRMFFGLPDTVFIVGVLGRLDKLKGQHVLLEAIPAVLNHFPNILFVLAGDETAGEHGYKDTLLTLARELKIESSVKFLPFTEDVPRLLSALDIFVLPSYSETFGLVVIEAMAMELPVIATHAGGVPEIITDGKTGLLIPPRNASALAEAILQLLSDASIRISLGREARKDALAKFDFEHCVDSILEHLAAL